LDLSRGQCSPCFSLKFVLTTVSVARPEFAVTARGRCWRQALTVAGCCHWLARVPGGLPCGAFDLTWPAPAGCGLAYLCWVRVLPSSRRVVRGVGPRSRLASPCRHGAQSTLRSTYRIEPLDMSHCSLCLSRWPWYQWRASLVSAS
jgi:hypothetical protein